MSMSRERPDIRGFGVQEVSISMSMSRERLARSRFMQELGRTTEAFEKKGFNSREVEVM